MPHRHFDNSFNRFGVNQNQHPGYIPQGNSYNSRVHMFPHLRGDASPESGPFHNLADQYARPQSNTGWRENEYFSVSGRMEVSLHQPVFPGPRDPYSIAASNFNPIPESNVSHIGHHDRLTSHEMNETPFHPITGAQRVSFKRKSPDVTEATQSGSTNRSCGAGGFSNSSWVPPEEPTPVYQGIHRMPIGFPHHRETSHSIPSEDTWRNVRSCHRPEVGSNTTGTHLFNYTSYQDHAMVNPTHHSSGIDHAHPHPEAAIQPWNCDPLSAGTRGSRDLAVGGSSEQTYWPRLGQGTTEIGVYRGNFMSSQCRPPSNYAHGGLADARGSQGSYSSAVVPSYRTDVSYPYSGHGTSAFSENGHFSLAESSSSRYISPLPAGRWQSAFGHGRSEILSDRSHSFLGMVDDETSATESLMMAHDSFSRSPINSFDEYREMRLDVDSMTYEALLALGERMGDVCTGLSEDLISKCLKVTKYHSSVQSKGISCAICLEDYKQEDEIGTIKKCGHDYHAHCIKKWLLMKNVCPVCKGAA